MPTARAWVRIFELEKRVREKQRANPGGEELPKDCERKLQEAKDWVAGGKEHRHSIQVLSPIWVPGYRVP
jgi:hypothetical protein